MTISEFIQRLKFKYRIAPFNIVGLFFLCASVLFEIRYLIATKHGMMDDIAPLLFLFDAAIFFAVDLIIQFIFWRIRNRVYLAQYLLFLAGVLIYFLNN